MSCRAFSAKSGQLEAGSTTTASSLRPSTPPFAFCSSTSISMTSFSVVSLIAIVPDKECRTPILIGSLAPCARAPRAAAAASAAANDKAPKSRRLIGPGIEISPMVTIWQAKQSLCHHIGLPGEGRMSRIFVTGSSDGLGRAAAQLLVAAGHRVVLHARNAARGRDAAAAVPGAEAVMLGDLASMRQTRSLAEAANASGPFDAVIHNAAIGFREKRRVLTEDGLAHVFAVNTLAPYMLTALMHRPRRLVYVSSELHRRGTAALDDLCWKHRAWRGNQAYSDTKLHDAVLACAVARRWPGVLSNALEPGWVATKMGGAHATGDLDAAPRTQVWLATSDEPAATVTGGYFFHLRPRKPNSAVHDTAVQDGLIAACERLSGVPFPAA